MIEVTVAHVGVDRSTNSPVVILREKAGNRLLPIWIGHAEAGAIAMEMQGVRAQRPLTHDLLRTLLASMGGQLRRVSITGMRENTYFAELLIQRDEATFAVDARPSDGIALALRARAPIFSAEQLLDTVGEGPAGAEAASLDDDTLRQQAETLRQQLERMDPQDFGKFQP